MLAPKPLKQLLEQADALIKSASPSSAIKQASVSNDEVSALASLLSGVESSVTVSSEGSASQEEMDKVAESLNRIQTAAELDEFCKLASFKKKAGEEGFTEDQIEEALSKIGAAKLAKSLPILTAMGVIVPGKEDRNKLPVKQKSKVLPRLDLTKSQGC